MHVCVHAFVHVHVYMYEVVCTYVNVWYVQVCVWGEGRGGGWNNEHIRSSVYLYHLVHLGAPRGEMFQEVLRTVQHLFCPILDVLDGLERPVGSLNDSPSHGGKLRLCVVEDLWGSALGGRGRW